MKGLAPLFLGIFGTFAFSWVGLTVLPNWQIGHLNPQSDEEGTDIYPQPQSGMFERGARVYAANGCIYCHSQQVRADYAAADIERGWGNRRSAPRDYIFERPVFLGKMRMGQDIANIGARAPAEQASPAPAGAAPPAASPSGGTSPAASSPSQGASSAAASPAAKQSPSPPPATQGTSPAPAGSPATAVAAAPATSPGSSTPGGAPPPGPKTGLVSPSPAAAANASFLYKKRRISDARSADALHLTGSEAPPEGWEVIPSYDAKCLVAYLMALNQSHPLKEARSAGGAPPAAGSPAPSPSPASAGSPAPAK